MHTDVSLLCVQTCYKYMKEWNLWKLIFRLPRGTRAKREKSPKNGKRAKRKQAKRERRKKTKIWLRTELWSRSLRSSFSMESSRPPRTSPSKTLSGTLTWSDRPSKRRREKIRILEELISEEQSLNTASCPWVRQKLIILKIFCFEMLICFRFLLFKGACSTCQINTFGWTRGNWKNNAFKLNLYRAWSNFIWSHSVRPVKYILQIYFFISQILARILLENILENPAWTCCFIWSSRFQNCCNLP